MDTSGVSTGNDWGFLIAEYTWQYGSQGWLRCGAGEVLAAMEMQFPSGARGTAAGAGGRGGSFFIRGSEGVQVPPGAEGLEQRGGCRRAEHWRHS